MENYLTVKRNGVLIHAMVWMCLLRLELQLDNVVVPCGQSRPWGQVEGHNHVSGPTESSTPWERAAHSPGGVGSSNRTWNQLGPVQGRME